MFVETENEGAADLDADAIAEHLMWDWAARQDLAPLLVLDPVDERLDAFGRGLGLVLLRGYRGM